MDAFWDDEVPCTIIWSLDLWPSFKKLHWVWCISPILFDVGIPNLGCWFLLGWQSGAYHFGSLWPWHWLLASFLGFSCPEHISYITANFPQMCLMLDQFLWGHSSRVCDISCFFLFVFLYEDFVCVCVGGGGYLLLLFFFFCFFFWGGGLHQIGLNLDLGSFLKNGGYFLGLLKFQIFFGGAWNSWYFCGVNGRWVPPPPHTHTHTWIKKSWIRPVATPKTMVSKSW